MIFRQRRTQSDSGVRPAFQSELAANEHVSTNPELDERPSVLVVEDNLQMNRVASDNLAEQYRVYSAFDGREALQKATELKPDLVLIDTIMPEMDGQELVEQLRACPEFDSMPIVVLSAMTDEELRVRLLRQGAQDYLTKPFAIEELRTRVTNLISKKRAEELAQRSALEQKLLAEISVVLASTLDYEETCGSIADLAARALADVCIVETLAERGEVRRTVARRGTVRRSWVRALQQLPLNLKLPHLGSSILETKQPLLMNDVSSAYLALISQNEQHHRLLLDLAPQAMLGMPLLAHGRLVGFLLLLRTAAEQPFSSADVALAQEVARRAALSAENARLYASAQRAIQLRDDVLGMVAHDLRNPLSAMLLQLRLLRRSGAQPERRTQEPIDAILREGTRLNILIQDLLDVARFEAGKPSVEPELISAGDVATLAVEGQRLLASEAGLELELESADSTSEVWGDAARLQQVFANLIGNAIKFTPPGGKITISVVPRRQDVLFSVVDSGPGIHSDQIPHLFDRFWQASHTDQRGAGLGLSIAKMIVEAHGGHIWVETSLGQGSTFRFAIPNGPQTTAA